MSVLIKGMEMPKSCNECRFAVDGWCYAYGKPNINALANEGRTNFCPLVPVPPHGRLIDADAFEQENAYFWNRDFINPKYSETLADLVNAAPTIIPAEEGE